MPSASKAGPSEVVLVTHSQAKIRRRSGWRAQSKLAAWLNLKSLLSPFDRVAPESSLVNGIRRRDTLSIIPT